MNNILIIIQVIAAIVLFVLIMLQTPKTDGLASMGAGQDSDSAYKGKMGKDEILSNYTKYAACIFFAVSLIIVFIKH